MKNKKVSEILTKARAALILDQPFFASIILPIPMIEDNSVNTWATDGEKIFYNSDWTEKLTLSEITFVLAHEVLHCVFEHFTRRGQRNHNRWNIAADYIINNALAEQKIGSMPKGGLHDPKIVKQGNGTAEGIYNILPKETEQKQSGTKGGAMDDIIDAGTGNQPGQSGGADCLKGPGNNTGGSMGPIIQGKGQPGKNPPLDQSTKTAKESEMRVKVIQAKNAAKMQGKLSDALGRLVDDLTKVKTDWRQVLRNFISQRTKSELSFARPKRRFLADDLNLPSLVGEKLGSIAIAVDFSGSVSQAEIQKFQREINAIIQDCRPSEIKIIPFNDIVLDVETVDVSDGQPINIKTYPPGGTAFSPIFEAIAQFEQPPIACIVLTDLYCNDFGPAPEYPVLWASTASEKAKFGDVVLIKDDPQ